MVIVPAEHPLDWKKPPVITLLLIVINVLIYFGYQGGDSTRREEAVRVYLAQDLLGHERPLFSASLERRDRLDADQQRALEALPRQQLAWLVLSDLEFGHELRALPAFQRDAAWQAARARAETARDQTSSLRFGFIPERFTVQGLFGSMFLHGSFWHLAGNMVFLFIFGFALEAALGRATYLGLYLLSGLCSGLLWWALDPSWVPGIGASGAISGLMGMYIGVYGLRRIQFFYWLGPLMGYLKAPALWILPLWLGKELFGLIRAADHVNYYAHIGGLVSGFLAVWLPRKLGRMPVDEAYLAKQDPDASFKRALAALDEMIGRFALDQAAARGPQLLQQFPGRPVLVERLYGIAKGRQDRALMSETLKQLFALPPSPGADALLRRLADDSAASDAALLSHPAIQLHLLRKLLQRNETSQALHSWRRLARSGQLPDSLPGLTLQLAKQMGQRGEVQAVRELSRFLRQHYPEADPTRQLTIYQQHLAP
ncbi:rhomboid family intramembrane serine protease [Pseudomonas nitroreducens]|uniref:Rhomboid family intramembrane serine protease n=1 Tax=Pseudomonas nitroreducens TaxID=46680 RepID=A0A246FFD8_PSENT|nr:rhomboid family intramembrane serine protease [Pseudomonas nitroreducens]OWP53022.1 rhomboid family intramembrane serine protease [Pseudomonas nitroreducens]